MGSRTSRSIFAVALCSGVAMVGASIHGLMGVDGELQRSVLAAQETIRDDSIRVIDRGDSSRDCPAPYTRKTDQRV
jgi:hypothetical protein